MVTQVHPNAAKRHQFQAKPQLRRECCIPSFKQNYSLRSGLRQFYLTMQIEVLWVLLTTKTNLGKFTVAHRFLAQALVKQ